jgi:periplasmic divalent cation tolerance protein
MTEIVSVYALFGSAEEARTICQRAVEDGLAACANILAPCHSIYRWKGRIEEAAEVPAVLKTRAELADRLIERIDSLHSYEVPAAVAWRIETAIPAYVEWVEAETGAGEVRAKAEA